jgi:hypothetical protein
MKTPHFTVTKINRLTLFKEIIAVCCKVHKNHIQYKNLKLLYCMVRIATANSVQVKQHKNCDSIHNGA